MPSVGIKVHGGEKYKDLLAKIAAQHAGLKVGILKNAKNDLTGEPVAPYAAVMEFGAHIRRGDTTIQIPARPFMQQTFNRRRKEWLNWLSSAMKADPTALRDHMDILGQRIAGDIVSEIENGQFEPLAQSTVRAKERHGNAVPTKPLVDTGSLEASVSYEVTE